MVFNLLQILSNISSGKSNILRLLLLEMFMIDSDYLIRFTLYMTLFLIVVYKLSPTDLIQRE